jgi:multiple sugar transport system substrate-binding protein
MKRIITLLMILAIAFSALSGCEKERARADVPVEIGTPADVPAQIDIPVDVEPSELVSIPANTEKTLTIVTQGENGFIDFAAKKYMERNPGVAVVINSHQPEEVTGSRDKTEYNAEEEISKFTQIINTSLMSGNAEDIIDVSSLSWAALADAGHLLNLKESLGLSEDDYYLNAITAYGYNAAQYAIPLSFSFTGFRFDKAFTETEIPVNLTLDKLVDLSLRHPENPLFSDSGGGQNAVSIAEMYFGMDFFEYIDLETKEARLDDGRFQALLEKVSLIADNARTAEGDEIPVLWENGIYNAALCTQGTEDYTGVFLLTNDKGLSLFSPVGFLPAVNANSKNKELAIDFMRFILSEEMQSSPELLFNPVNKKAAAALAAQILVSAEADGYAPENFDIEANIVLYNSMADNLGAVRYSDWFVRNFMIEEMSRYFEGQVTAEQAAASLQATINTYLKE